MDENIEKYYQVLNLEPTASPEEIYQAYRDLARVWDPQRFAHSPRLEMKAEEKLSEIIAAYHALLPNGNSGASASAGGFEPLEPEPPKLPRDPFAAPEPAPRPIADLHRPVELPRTEEPPIRPVVHPDVQQEVHPSSGLLEMPAPWSASPVAAAPEETGAGAAVEPPKPHRSRWLALAAAAVTGFVVVGGAIFLYQAMSAPPPSTALPDPTPPAGLSPDSSLTADADSSRPAAAGAPQNQNAPAARRPARRNAVAEEQPRQYATGTELIAPAGRAGAGRFHIDNRSGEDAVARVSSQRAPETALRLVYVRAGTEVNVANIGPGVYFVSFSMGPVTSKPRKFGARFGPFQFVQIQSTTGYESDHYQIVLKPQP